GLGKALDTVAREPGGAKLRVRAVVGDLDCEAAQELHRAGDRVRAVVRPARVRGGSAHDHSCVDAAAVAELQLEAVAVDEGDVGAYAFRLDHVADRVVLAGLARDAADEVQLAMQSNFRFLNGFYR